ncbi:MAG: hypothetical protein COT17_00750 [Elusimicrobia bacterium CG08_land_8_20_14_0_20_51_18]|nr:MAG: hypothetical protein COT17_00750 [Elusimicrobia bacterium CG08_land_8_20_14_0_20_51_18]
MNIETLKVFKDLIETENFSRTAELNYISQSAVSQQLKKLEMIFKAKLFLKKENGFSLTPQGRIFYNSAKKILLIYNGTLSEIKQTGVNVVNGELRISAIYTLGIYLIGDYIKKFLNLNPFTRLDLEYKKYSDVIDDVSGGNVDFGFIACGAIKGRDIAAINMGEEELALIASPSLAPFNLKTINLRDISKFKLVLFDKSTPSRKYIEKILRGKSVKMNVTMEIDNVEAIKATVMSNAGVSIVPLSCVKNEERENKLKVLRFNDVKLMRPVSMIYNKKKKTGSTFHNFLNMMLAIKKNHLLGGKNGI